MPNLISRKSVIAHGEDSDEEAIIYTGEELMLAHSAETEETKAKKSESSEDEETVADVFNTLTEKQKTVVYALIGQALEDNQNDKKGEDNKMKHNVFESDNGTQQGGTLCHSDMVNIINLAKSNSVGSLQDAIGIYMENNTSLSHGFEDIDQLFPEYKDVRPGAPELLQRDQGWVSVVMQKAHKSPISRIRTRQIDARDLTGRAGLRGYGYDDEKRNKAKVAAGNVKLLKRTTDPQTVFSSISTSIRRSISLKRGFQVL